MNKLLLLTLLPAMLFASTSHAQVELQFDKKSAQFKLIDSKSGSTYLSSPPEGLWSIASDWENDWPSQWIHGQVAKIEQQGEWTIAKGQVLINGELMLARDACRRENTHLFKCVRRFQWQGKKPINKATLSVRWQFPASGKNAFIPAVMYYGNPAGQSTHPERVPNLHGKKGEYAIFEEHRPASPLVSFEWQNKVAALHSLPSQIRGGNKNDQWWSIGMENLGDKTELKLLSGPLAYNNMRSMAKALKHSFLPYPDAYVKIEHGDIIEKTYYLEAHKNIQTGSGFRKPMHTAIDIFKPFYLDDLPSEKDILKNKFTFMKSRWLDEKKYAGFNTYDNSTDKFIFGFGWVGQAAAPGFALQHLQDYLPEEERLNYIQKSLDFLSTSPVSKIGFVTDYDAKAKKWDPKSGNQSYVAQAQGLFNVVRAIESAQNNKKLNTRKWKKFARKALDMHSKRILRKDWHPESTNEGFFIAPLLLGDKLFNKKKYTQAALKAADHYIERHLTMKEPYWGGTLDATGEDKEGAWAAFQGFLSAYDATKNKKYLNAAEHAADVVLSYVVTWDIPMPAGRLSDHFFKTRGWTAVSPQNHHLDVYGVLIAPWIYKLADIQNDENLKRIAKVMYRSCGQMIDPYGSHGEQMLQTNYAQRYRGHRVTKGQIKLEQMRGDYAEMWNVMWIAAHFMVGSAMFEQMGVEL